jgi:hypothetical protein
MEPLIDQVRRIVQDVASVRSVMPNTRLWHDLSLGGDDVIELLERLEAKFGTSFADLPFTDFFPEEGAALGDHFLKLLGLKGDRKPVTVQHLADVVNQGAWFDPSETGSTVKSETD